MTSESSRLRSDVDLLRAVWSRLYPGSNRLTRLLQAELEQDNSPWQQVAAQWGWSALFWLLDKMQSMQLEEGLYRILLVDNQMVLCSGPRMQLAVDLTSRQELSHEQQQQWCQQACSIYARQIWVPGVQSDEAEADPANEHSCPAC